MIKLAIINDELETIKEIKEICNVYFKKINYPFICNYFLTASSFLESNDIYDIIIIKIELRDMFGLNLAKKIRKADKECCICFISTSSKYTLEAYQVHAFDFIRKPFHKKHIYKILNDFFKYYESRIISKQKLTFSNYKQQFSIFMRDIIYFEYFDKNMKHQNRCTVLYTKENEYALKMKISYIIDTLPSYLFFMPHKSFIINFLFIKSINKNDIMLTNSKIIPLSQKRASTFRRKYAEFLSKSGFKERILSTSCLS